MRADLARMMHLALSSGVERGDMSQLLASRDFPATPDRLADIRDFVKAYREEGAEHLPLLVTELVTLLIGMTPWLTVRVSEHGDRLMVEVGLDATRESSGLQPDGLAGVVIENLTDELVIDLDNLTLTALTPIHHPAYSPRGVGSP